MFMVLLIGASFETHAQQAIPPKIFVTKELGRITAVLDTLTGRFAVRCNDGKSILFGHEFSNTSHISVKIGNRIYANYWFIKLRMNPNVTDLGKGMPEILGDRLRYTWKIHNAGGDYMITQDLIPTQDTSMNEALVQVHVRCLSGKATTAGIAMEMDVDAAGNDKAPVTVNGAKVVYETEYCGAAIPDAWTVQTPEFGMDVITGRMIGAGCNAPRRFIAGNWQTGGDLGTAVYGYGSVGHFIGDAAVYYEWPETTLDTNTDVMAGTRVGLNTSGGNTKKDRNFGTFFVYTTAPLLIISAEETTNISIHRYADDWCESDNTFDISWDTTCTVPAGHFNLVYSGMPRLHSFQPGPDSVRLYRYSTAVLRSDKPIGIQYPGGVARGDHIRTLSIVQPYDTVFIYPGGHTTGYCELTNTTDEDYSVDFTSTGVQTAFYSTWQHDLYPKGSHFNYSFPGYGTTKFQTWFVKMYAVPTNYTEYRYTSDDGAGMVVKASKPCRLIAEGLMDPSMIPRLPDTMSTGYGREIIPSTGNGGREFCFIPYQQQYTPAYDLVRIIPFENYTSVRLSEGGKSFLLNRGDHLDTLLAVATVIRSDKPMAVYQYPMRMTLLKRSDVQTGTVLSLQAREHWGSAYYSVSGAKNLPSVMYWNYNLNMYYYSPELHFMRIIREEASRDSVYLNGTVVDFSNGTLLGRYRYLELPRVPGFDVIECKSPISVTTYGGYGNEGMLRLYGLNIQSLGYAHTPLYK